jgi:hypothetical protein
MLEAPSIYPKRQLSFKRPAVFGSEIRGPLLMAARRVSSEK